MPLNWNDETIPSEADKTTDILGFKEIGGIGQLIYHPFRFKKYELDIDKSDDYCATPFCRPGYEPIFPKEDFLSGQGLLTSLCNLAMQINSFDNKIPYTQLIMEWCTNNMHPYNIDFIYSELNESFDINSFDAEMVEKDGTFEINNFLDDLGKLYNAVMFYVALEGICIADDEAAYDLSKEGKYFEGYSFFDKYKHPIVAIPDDLDYGDAKGNLYDELRNALIDIIPEFTMKLKVEFNDGYALADSRYFSYYDGDMLLLPGYDGECVIKAFYRKKRNKKKVKEILEAKVHTSEGATALPNGLVLVKIDYK